MEEHHLCAATGPDGLTELEGGKEQVVNLALSNSAATAKFLKT